MSKEVSQQRGYNKSRPDIRANFETQSQPHAPYHVTKNFSNLTNSFSFLFLSFIWSGFNKIKFYSQHRTYFTFFFLRSIFPFNNAFNGSANISFNTIKLTPFVPFLSPSVAGCLLIYFKSSKNCLHLQPKSISCVSSSCHKFYYFQYAKSVRDVKAQKYILLTYER